MQRIQAKMVFCVFVFTFYCSFVVHRLNFKSIYAVAFIVKLIYDTDHFVNLLCVLYQSFQIIKKKKNGLNFRWLSCIAEAIYKGRCKHFSDQWFFHQWKKVNKFQKFGFTLCHLISLWNADSMLQWNGN